MFVIASESNISSYSLNVIKENQKRVEEAEATKDSIEETQRVLFAVAFRELGNRTSIYKLTQFEEEIKKV